MDRRGSLVKVVVDTNVVAYYLLGTPKFIAEARDFWTHAGELQAPAVWEAEIANVIWMAARTGVLTRTEATERLALAGRLGIRSVSNRGLWHAALAHSHESTVAVYDTLFVALAEREATEMATFDQKVLDAFPTVAKRPRDLGSSR